MSENLNINYSIYDFYDALEEEMMYDNSINEARESGFVLNFSEKTDNEIEIEKLVESTLKYAPEPKLEEVDDIDSILRESVTSLEIFGKEYIDYLSKINIKIYPDSHYLAYSTLFSNTYYLENGKPIGDVMYITIPDKLYKFSPIIIGHEYTHSLKDAYYYEFLDKMIFGEVLPQFYEIIAAETKLEKAKEEWLKIKLFSQYELIKYKDDYDQTQILNEKLGLYYSLLMYNLYRKYPKKVLNGVNSVLQHKKTTRELLKEMGIYKLNKNTEKIYKQEKRILFNK